MRTIGLDPTPALDFMHHQVFVRGQNREAESEQDMAAGIAAIRLLAKEAPKQISVNDLANATVSTPAVIAFELASNPYITWEISPKYERLYQLSR